MRRKGEKKNEVKWAVNQCAAGKVEIIREARSRSARNFLESLRGLESGQFLCFGHFEIRYVMTVRKGVNTCVWVAL